MTYLNCKYLGMGSLRKYARVLLIGVVLIALVSSFTACNKEEETEIDNAVSGGLTTNVEQESPCLIEEFFNIIYPSIINSNSGIFTDITMFQDLNKDLKTYESFTLHVTYRDNVLYGPSTHSNELLNMLSTFESPDYYRVTGNGKAWHLTINCFHKRASIYLLPYSQQ